MIVALRLLRIGTRLVDHDLGPITLGHSTRLPPGRSRRHCCSRKRSQPCESQNRPQTTCSSRWSDLPCNRASWGRRCCTPEPMPPSPSRTRERIPSIFSQYTSILVDENAAVLAHDDTSTAIPLAADRRPAVRVAHALDPGHATVRVPNRSHGVAPAIRVVERAVTVAGAVHTDAGAQRCLLRRTHLNVRSHSSMDVHVGARSIFHLKARHPTGLVTKLPGLWGRARQPLHPPQPFATSTRETSATAPNPLPLRGTLRMASSPSAQASLSERSVPKDLLFFHVDHSIEQLSARHAVACRCDRMHLPFGAPGYSG